MSLQNKKIGHFERVGKSIKEFTETLILDQYFLGRIDILKFPTNKAQDGTESITPTADAGAPKFIKNMISSVFLPLKLFS